MIIVLHMKKYNLRIIVPTVLLALLISILIPGAVIAQGPALRTQQALSIFSEVFRHIEKRYVDEVDPEVLLEGALNGLLESLNDPHSAYLSGASMRDISDTTRGKFGGVGLYIQKQAANEDEEAFIEVISPIDGTPSARLDIRSNDLIIEISNQSTGDFTIDDAVSALRGEIGSPVEVLIRRGTREFPLSIVRASIEIPTIRYALIPDSKIGYIRIIQFTPFTVGRVMEAIEEFETMGYQSLIVDVRQNPGGLLSSVVELSSLFLDGGIIVGTSGKNATENRKYYATKGTFANKDIPMVVLIDGGSASASEIFAGALGDRDRAVTIGQKSFGKGSVQQIERAGDGAFRLTISRYYTPAGNYIDKIGITPHIVSEAAEFTEEQAVDMTTLLSQRRLEKFVNNRTTVSNQEIDRFVTEIINTTSLEKDMVEKLVRDEILSANNVTPIFDVEFDTVLQRAIKYLTSK